MLLLVSSALAIAGSRLRRCLCYWKGCDFIAKDTSTLKSHVQEHILEKVNNSHA